MSINRGFCRAAPIMAAAFLINACASSASTTSYKSPAYDRNPKGVVVIQSVTEFFLATYAPTIHQVLSQDMAGCGIVSRPITKYTQENVADLGNQSAQLDISAKVKEINADGVLTIAQTSNTRTNGTLTHMTYAATFFDITLKRVVWKAQIDISNGHDAASVLANEIASRLAADGVFRSCPKKI